MGLREELINSFQDTIHFVETNAVLLQKTTEAVKKTHVTWQDDSCCTPIFPIPNQYEGSISVVEDTSFHAAQKLVKSGKRTAVLNFASAVNPGGGVSIGAMAQEECLCRSSNLYFCLKQSHLMRDYYMPHRVEKNPFYSDKLIYSQNVVVFKTDDDIPVLLPEKEWFEVDVITCAAPNLREVSNVDEEKLKQVLFSRIYNILREASERGARALVLGAFGCGAFKNPPEVVAEAAYEIIQEYVHSFETIEFAIYSSQGESKNLSTFKRVFNIV